MAFNVDKYGDSFERYCLLDPVFRTKCFIYKMWSEYSLYIPINSSIASYLSPQIYKLKRIPWFVVEGECYTHESNNDYLKEGDKIVIDFWTSAKEDNIKFELRDIWCRFIDNLTFCELSSKLEEDINNWEENSTENI